MSKHFEFLDTDIIAVILDGEQIGSDPMPLDFPGICIGDPTDAAGIIQGDRSELLTVLDRMRQMVERLPEDHTFGSKVFDAAVAAMLWANTQNGEGESLEHPSGEFDYSPRYFELLDLVDTQAFDQLRADLVDFLTLNLADVRDLDPGQVGHDFILTRNRHGAGFWDRGLGEKGDRLTEAAQTYGELTWFQAEDGAPIGTL